MAATVPIFRASAWTARPWPHCFSSSRPPSRTAGGRADPALTARIEQLGLPAPPSAGRGVGGQIAAPPRRGGRFQACRRAMAALTTWRLSSNCDPSSRSRAHRRRAPGRWRAELSEEVAGRRVEHRQNLQQGFEGQTLLPSQQGIQASGLPAEPALHCGRGRAAPHKRSLSRAAIRLSSEWIGMRVRRIPCPAARCWHVLAFTR